MSDPVAKRRFESRVSFGTLSTFGFDLSAKMGALLAEQRDLSDLNTMKAVFGALFPTATVLKGSLDDANLRLLSERRHVIVHRRGVVDESYIKAIGCAERAGERLRVPRLTWNATSRPSYAVVLSCFADLKGCLGAMPPDSERAARVPGLPGRRESRDGRRHDA